MDLRTLTKLVLKIMGIYLLVTAAVALPPVISYPKPYNIESGVFLAFYGVLGFVLVWIPGGFINTVIRIPSGQIEGTITARKLLQVGCILLGVYFAVTGAFSFLYTYAQARLFYDVVRPFENSRGPDLNPEDFARLFANAIKFMAGLCLWLGSRYVVRFTREFQDDG